MDKSLVFKVRRGSGVGMAVTQLEAMATDYEIYADVGEHNVVGRRKMIVAALEVLRVCSPDELAFADGVLNTWSEGIDLIGNDF